jgi:hypothetical protein
MTNYLVLQGNQRKNGYSWKRKSEILKIKIIELSSGNMNLRNFNVTVRQKFEVLFGVSFTLSVHLRSMYHIM